MFFLLRTAFWIGLVILLLPIDTGSQDDATAGVSPWQALSAAQSTVSDISSFCTRNPNACETGGQALRTFGAKARESARLVYEYLDEGASPETLDNTLTTGSTGTLTADDLAPQWVGPALPLPAVSPSFEPEAAKVAPEAPVALPQPKPLNRSA
ncbi:hypothetical protein GR183_12520 [Stappia sp. GBMRC 2046]|uniref:DUF5330 domain-containing protein n=1 Tax=Stappia sediminis TaxID=2692190 RepID=A0A7X3S8D4_9HYPH|nr:DUF5330 domain-containing protein [Stappia sediminis]MXN65731.1 hypothetical protein [Stappia sediminis]